jgi:hypothetical protein
LLVHFQLQQNLSTVQYYSQVACQVEQVTCKSSKVKL